MPEFLSDEWIAALDEAAQADEHLRDLTADVELKVQQKVTGGPSGDVAYGLTISAGTVRVSSGPLQSADVRFQEDHETAAAIASGSLSAQEAFMTGRLRVGGNLQVLVDHTEVIAALHDVFGNVRAETPLTDRGTGA
ncbi:MAG: SCP2 sterol-binding domain-containing protein [Acidimicrobiales bacterium]|nr:SCP2 sterol-binding domain-containing protein [Acidimicrobiales bacterium]